MEENVYPKHLYEPIRVEIANCFLKREFRKLFADLRGTGVWEKIDLSIDNLFPNDRNVVRVRNFWNTFYAVAGGILLKPGFIQVLTADNVAWEYRNNLPLDQNIASGGELKYIHESLGRKETASGKIATILSAR